MTPRQFWAISVLVGIGAFLVLFPLSRALGASVPPSAAAAFFPYLYWSAQRRKQAVARLEAWPDALRHLSGRLQSGVSTLHEALEELARTGPAPLRPAMARYGRLSNRVSQVQALEILRGELADPITDSVLLTLEMAAEEGTEQVVHILVALTEQIQGDLQLAEKIRTVQTQSRIAAWAVFALPYALLVFLCSTQPFYRDFFSSPGGLLIIAIGAVMSCIGLVLARRLGRPIPTFERVFVTGRA